MRKLLLLFLLAPAAQAQSVFFELPRYAVAVEPGPKSGPDSAPDANPVPRLRIERDGEPVFVVPIVSGLAAPGREEHLAAIEYTLRHPNPTTWELEASAHSDLWQHRRFLWRFLPDRIEFQHFASGHGPLGRCYFLSNGVSHSWDAGSTGGKQWDTAIYADRYFS